MKNYISNREIDGPVKDKLIETLNRFIRVLRSTFSIHCMMTGGHSPKSYHFKGTAADGHKGRFAADRRPSRADEVLLLENLMKIIHSKDKSIFEQAILSRLSGFTGIGIYPNWTPAPGLHQDLRPKPLTWIGLNREKLQKELDKTKEGEQVYIYLV